MKTFDVYRIREDFPILKIKVHGKPFVYLDNAATSQKPKQVIDAIVDYYRKYNANIHRGIYQVSEHATEAYTLSKEKTAAFINAKEMEEMVYVRNSTEAINIIALGWGEANIKNGDHILVSEMEHHSNIVPWQMLARRKHAVLDYVKLDRSKTRLDMDSLKKELEKRPKMVAITHESNVLGTINDAKEICRLGHASGAKVLIDGAQSVPHMKVDVKDMGCDFLVFSGHKMLAPTGIGVLYAKRDILEEMPPVFGGGDMIKEVDFQSSVWNDLPWRFEAGTPNIEGGIGLGAAVDYINGVGIGNIRKYEKELTSFALDSLSDMNGVSVFGLGKDRLNERGSVVSFALKGVHPHDIASILDEDGIAIRAGSHCAMPLVRGVLGEAALARISFYLYNTKGEIETFTKALGRVRELFHLRG